MFNVTIKIDFQWLGLATFAQVQMTKIYANNQANASFWGSLKTTTDNTHNQ